jgi:uncharacterized protein with NRDE domain
MLVVLHRCDPDAPLVLAANRDEYLDRPAEGLALRDVPSGGEAGRRASGPAVLCPRDLRAGGTWHGLSERGLFAALTNRPTRRRDDTRRSRGLLVLDVLAAGSLAEATASLLRLPADAYNPFNLLLADGRDACVVVYEDKPALHDLAPGVHVIANADPDDRRVPKVARLLARAERAAAGPRSARLDALAEICRGHEDGDGPLGASCIHAGAYGTRSSTLLELGARPGAGELRQAEGPPCTTTYRDFSHLLRDLFRSPEEAAGVDARGVR